MSDPSASRFVAQNTTTQERLSTNTVGLVALSDFRKRRAEVLEQQEREAREALLGTGSTQTSTPNRSQTATPNNASETSEGEKQPRKKKKRAKALVSFGDDDEEEEDEGADEGFAVAVKGKPGFAKKTAGAKEGAGDDGNSGGETRMAKITPNSSVGVAPRALTKAALRREAAEREALRKKFLAMQVAVKTTEFAIPFVFYDGTNTPGGVVRVKKGDFVWVFLDKSRKVGAGLGVGRDKNAHARRDWARISVDDLMMVRGSIIIPPHYEFYFFIMNKTVGPGNQPLFGYRAEASRAQDSARQEASVEPLSKGGANSLPDIKTLEGASDDPTFTKVVDRRWYERNKHIYPASVWQEFDPEKNYQDEIRRDPGGNAFFFSK